MEASALRNKMDFQKLAKLSPDFKANPRPEFHQNSGHTALAEDPGTHERPEEDFRAPGSKDRGQLPLLLM